jgi:hypothetical protein
MNRFNVETAVGLFVLAGILCLGWLSVKLGKLEIGAAPCRWSPNSRPSPPEGGSGDRRSGGGKSPRSR